MAARHGSLSPAAHKHLSPVPISAGIMFFTFFLAFSDFCRAYLWWLWSQISTFIVVQTPLYSTWLDLRDNWSSQALLKSAAENVRKMKDEVRRKKATRKAEKNGAKDPKGVDSPDKDSGSDHAHQGNGAAQPAAKENGYASAKKSMRAWNSLASRFHRNHDDDGASALDAAEDTSTRNGAGGRRVSGRKKRRNNKGPILG